MLRPGEYVLSLMQQAMSIPTRQTFVLLLSNVFGPSLTSQATPSLILANSYAKGRVSLTKFLIKNSIKFIPAAQTAYNMHPFEPHHHEP
jgi:hypothetical protein